MAHVSEVRKRVISSPRSESFSVEHLNGRPLERPLDNTNLLRGVAKLIEKRIRMSNDHEPPLAVGALRELEETSKCRGVNGSVGFIETKHR